MGGPECPNLKPFLNPLTRCLLSVWSYPDLARWYSSLSALMGVISLIGLVFRFGALAGLVVCFGAWSVHWMSRRAVGATMLIGAVGTFFTVQGPGVECDAVSMGY